MIDNPSPSVYGPLSINSYHAIIPSLPYSLLLSKYELPIIACHQFGVQRRSQGVAMKEYLDPAESHMKKAILSFQRDLTNIRTGKATPSMLEGITVDYYGTQTPITQVATISVPEPRLLVIQPWEKTMLQPVAKAIQASDLGLNPQDDGAVLKIPIPQLNEERRKALAKRASGFAEECRVSVRNGRREANDALKKAQKEGDVSEDDSRRAQEQVQKLHDKYIADVDSILKAKESEIMEV